MGARGTASIASGFDDGLAAGPRPVDERSEADDRLHRRILEPSGRALPERTTDSPLRQGYAVRHRATREADRAARSVAGRTAIIPVASSA